MNMRSCCDELSAILKVISDNSRLKILKLLSRDTCCVCDIYKNLDLSQSLVSHHLSDLKKANLVSYKKLPPKVLYSLTKKGKQITNLIFKIKP
mgnify:CR=1 FL=1